MWLAAAVGQGAVGGDQEGDAVGEGDFPVEGVVPLGGDEQVALVQEGQDGADHQGGYRRPFEHRPVQEGTGKALDGCGRVGGSGSATTATTIITGGGSGPRPKGKGRGGLQVFMASLAIYGVSLWSGQASSSSGRLAGRKYEGATVLADAAPSQNLPT